MRDALQRGRLSLKDWNPDSYLRFADERTQPSIDLVSRIRIESPKRIVDIGCGPGNSTQALHRRWPASDILGTDSSEAMIAKARRDFPEQRWEAADACRFDAREEFDLVFSNAALQWIPDHEALVPRLFGGVRAGGALAFQVPMFKTMPINQAIEEVAARPERLPMTAGAAEVFTFRDAPFYYDLLSGSAAKIEIWETDYVHVLDSPEALLAFAGSTALRPYYARLASEAERSRFDEELLEALGQRYPARGDGKLLFPFSRLFVIAYKAE